MENKKTIGDLNGRAWYRLLKVIFILGLFAVLAIFNIAAFSSGTKQLDLNATKVQCNTQYYVNQIPEGYKQFSLNDVGLDLPLNNGFDYKDFYSNPYNEYEVKTILSKCSGVNNFNQIDLSFDQVLADIQKDNPSITTDSAAVTVYNNSIQNYENNDESEDNAVSNTLNNLETYDGHQFDITPVFTYTAFLELFFIGNIIILLVFEIMKRAFYYIVLGSIKPKK